MVNTSAREKPQDSIFFSFRDGDLQLRFYRMPNSSCLSGNKYASSRHWWVGTKSDRSDAGSPDESENAVLAGDLIGASCTHRRIVAALWHFERFTMNKQASLQLESLESRETPSATPLVESAFFPPGVIRGFDPQPDPPVVNITRDAGVAFLPPGVINAFDPQPDPPSVQLAADGSIVFLPPGIARGVAAPS